MYGEFQNFEVLAVVEFFPPSNRYRILFGGLLLLIMDHDSWSTLVLENWCIQCRPLTEKVTADVVNGSDFVFASFRLIWNIFEFFG